MSLAEDKIALEFTSSPESNKWLELIQSSNYSKALEELDSILNTNNFSILERLWWIRCQLHLNLLPISTLTSPLEEIYPQVIQSKDHSGLAISTFFKISKSLQEKSQSRLSLLMVERADEINKNHSSLNEQQNIELKNFYIQTLETELKNAQNKKENLQYISNLEKKLVDSKKTNKKSEWTLNHIIGNNNLENSKSETNSEKTTTTHKNADLKPKYNLVKYAIVLLLLLFAAHFALTRSQDSEAQLALSLPMPNSKPLEPKFNFGKNPSILSGVEKRLESLGDSSSSQASIATNPSEVDAQAITQANNIEVPEAIQDEELESISGTTKGEEQIPKTKIPRLDPKNVGAANVETVEQSPRRAGVAPSLPEIINNEPRIPEGKTLEGKILQSYEVEVFEPPLVYQTITGSEVLSAPSLLSKSMARLEPGTHIYVIKKMGLWLEIRSTGGRIGYIYAQDAEQIKQN